LDDIYTYDYVKEYWDRFFPTVESAEDEQRRFVNPGEDGATVRVPEYLAQLDDRAIREVLNRRYRVLPGRERYPRAAMFKAMVWRRVIGERSLLDAMRTAVEGGAVDPRVLRRVAMRRRVDGDLAGLLEV
jgi:hypothetical protein